jgi:ABC-type multidrug transport system ATPase subunit
MKQRIGIAQALLNDPQLLIVDEPTVGLDPEERVRFRNLIADLAGERIVILSTHIVSDVEATATRIVIANHGHLILDTNSEDLLRLVEGNVWEWIVSAGELTEIKRRHLVSGAFRRSDGMQMRVISSTSPAKEARPVAPTFEDAYLKLISNGSAGGNGS